MDVHGGGECLLPIGEHLGGRWLVGNEDPDLLGMLRHQGEGIRGPAAAGEEVDGPGAELGDQPVQVVGMLVGRGLRRPVGPLATL